MSRVQKDLEALSIRLDTDSKWVQGSMANTEGAVCLLGGVIEVTGNHDDNCHRVTTSRIRCASKRRGFMIRALADCIADVDGKVAWRRTYTARKIAVVDYNDATYTYFGDIRNVIDCAIDTEKA